ncbi:MAG TPA: DUF2628 domain-containing protein [Mesorhizobium sp.]|jgi:hypothetical protein
MAVYVVMEPPGRGNAVDTAFMRDGFSWPGFLVPPLWLLWHRLWIEAVLAFVAIGLLIALGETFDAPLSAMLLVVLVMLYVGLEGQALRVGALARRGWRQWGVVVADDVEDADARYALDAGGDPAEDAPPLSMTPDPTLARPTRHGSLGLVPFSGRP